MSIESLFEIPEKLSEGQTRWLKMCAAIPGVKSAFVDAVTSEDKSLAKDASKILNEKGVAHTCHA